jgi:hypothetical protein
MNERRKEPRYRVRDGVFAIDVNESQRLGEIIDISRSGISFRYMNGQNKFDLTTALNIFSSTHSLFLNQFPFETVSDIPVQGHPASAITMKRTSGMLHSLSDQQQEQLDSFIDLHSTHPV